MRNLKKILALVLALMMVLSVMVTASAAFEDADSIQYAEAVDVMAAAGILTGYKAEDGTYTFNPKGTLTRAEAAKLIAYLDTAGKISGIVQCETVFEDVAAGHWASGLINYCYDEGIINGKTETTFVPNGKISVQEYAKLLLCVLGVEGTYTGANWTKDVRNNAIANKLMAGMTYTWTADVTREQAAQMTFNAMTVGSTTTPASSYWYFMQDGKEVKVAEKDLALYIALKVDVKSKDVEPTSTGFFKSFGITVTESKDGGKDAYGRPALVYTVDQGKDAEGKEIPDVVLAYAEAPVAIFTSEMDTVAIAAAIKALKEAKYTVDSKVTFTEDGVSKAGDYYSAGVAITLESEAGNNTVVELFAGDDNVIDTAVITNTKVDTVKEVIEANAEKKIKAAIVLTDGGKVETTGYTKGEVVTYTLCGAKVENLAKAEYVVGTLTSYNSKGEYTIDGKVYTLDGVSDATVQAQFGESFVYYLGDNNTIIYTTNVAGASAPQFSMPTDYVVVKDAEVKYTVTATTPDSFAGETATKSISFSARVKVLHEDGSYALYNLPVVLAAEDLIVEVEGKEVKLAGKGDYYTVINNGVVILLTAEDAAKAEPKQGGYDITSIVKAALTAQVYAYTAEEGAIALYAVSAIDKKAPAYTKDAVVVGCTNNTEIKANAIVVDDFFGNKVLVNADTKVVYEYEKTIQGKKVMVTEIGTLGNSLNLAAGYHGMIINVDVTKNAKNEVVSTVYTAELIFVQGAPKTETAKDVDVVYVVEGYTVTGEQTADKKALYTYTAYTTEGAVIELKSTVKGLSAGLYKYDTNGMIGEGASANKSGEYNLVAGTTVTVGSDYLTVTENTVVVEVGTFTLKDKATVLVFTNEKDANIADVIFVINNAAE